MASTQEHWLCFNVEEATRRVAESLACPHLGCACRACRRNNRCSGPTSNSVPLCMLYLAEHTAPPAIAFLKLACDATQSFLRSDTSPPWLATADALSLVVVEEHIRALIPRRRWRELRRWLIRLGVDHELLTVKRPSTGFAIHLPKTADTQKD